MASQSFIYLVTLTFTEIWRNFPQKMIFTCFLFQTLHKTVIRKVYHWRKLGNAQKFSKNAKFSKEKWISALELAKNSWKVLRLLCTKTFRENEYLVTWWLIIFHEILSTLIQNSSFASIQGKSAKLSTAQILKIGLFFYFNSCQIRQYFWRPGMIGMLRFLSRTLVDGNGNF